jgi:hypothetical protein
MAAGDVWKAAVISQCAGQEQVQTFHLRDKSGALTADLIGDKIITDWVEEFAPYQGPQISTVRVEVRKLSIPPVGSDIVTDLPVAGSASFVVGSLTDALVVSERTSFLGRSYRGRVYVPGLARDFLQEGAWLTGVTGPVQTFVDEFVTLYGAEGSDDDMLWGVWSPKLGNVYTSGVLTGYNYSAGFHGITSASVDSVVHVQRRRALGTGS